VTHEQREQVRKIILDEMNQTGMNQGVRIERAAVAVERWLQEQPAYQLKLQFGSKTFLIKCPIVQGER
jgi:hypothetical protein